MFKDVILVASVAAIIRALYSPFIISNIAPLFWRISKERDRFM